MKMPEVEIKDGKVVRKNYHTVNPHEVVTRTPDGLAGDWNVMVAYISALHDKIDDLLSDGQEANGLARVWVIENPIDAWNREIPSYLAVSGWLNEKKNPFGDFVWMESKDDALAFPTEADAIGFLRAIQKKLQWVPHHMIDWRLMEAKHKLNIVEHVIATPEKETKETVEPFPVEVEVLAPEPTEATKLEVRIGIIDPVSDLQTRSLNLTFDQAVSICTNLTRQLEKKVPGILGGENIAGWWDAFVRGVDIIGLKGDFYIHPSGEVWVLSRKTTGPFAEPLVYCNTIPQAVVQYMTGSWEKTGASVQEGGDADGAD